MALQIPGIYYDGQSSIAHPAKISYDDSFFIIETDSGTFKKTGRFLARVGRAPQTIEFNDGGSFQSSEPALIKLKSELDGFDLPFWLESKLRFALLSVLIVSSLMFYCYRYAFPTIAEKIALQVPESVNDRISQQTQDLIENSKTLTPSQLSFGEQFKIQTVFEKLKTIFPGMKLEPVLRNGKEIGANAFALPNGHIYVTDQITTKLSEEELLAVLCHEVGHVNYHHGLRSLIESSAISVFLLSVSGTIDWTGLPLALLTSGYSRKFETEADDFSVATLKKNGMKPSLLADALKKIDKPDKNTNHLFDWFLSHPSTQERIDRILKQ